MSSTTARRRARQKTAPQAETTPEPVTEPELSCEVCHIPGDEKTLENRGGENVPYYLCKEVSECDERIGIARRKVLAEDEAQAGEAAAEEPAEATT